MRAADTASARRDADDAAVLLKNLRATGNEAIVRAAEEVLVARLRRW
jgi:hypothetical protein